MYNHNFIRFRAIAKTVSTLLFLMADLWEELQYYDNEPPCLKDSTSYPCDKSFNDFAYDFKTWFDTFDKGVE